MAGYLTSEKRRKQIREANQRFRERNNPNLRRQITKPELVPTEEDKAYAAGFIDGEGYVGALKKRDGVYVAPRIAVSQVANAPLEFMRQRWAGTVGFHSKVQENRRPAYQWVLGNKALVCAFIDDIYPFLMVKSEQALLVHELAQLPNLIRGQDNSKLIGKRNELYEKLRDLNRVGSRRN